MCVASALVRTATDSSGFVAPSARTYTEEHKALVEGAMTITDEKHFAFQLMVGGNSLRQRGAHHGTGYQYADETLVRVGEEYESSWAA